MAVQSSVLDHVASIPPYPPGRPIAAVAREFGLDPAKIVKLASNENALGMAPAAREILTALAEDPSRYPDSDGFDLRGELARQLKTTPDRILLGAGSSEPILLVARAFLEPGRVAVLSRYSFVSYEAAIRSVGATARIVDTKDWAQDLDGLLAAIDEDVRVLYVASPNNPTGTLIAPDDLSRFIAAVPPHVVVVLDEAYRDFVRPAQRPDTDRLLAIHPNLLVLRTFSKVYGLAGLRVGYALGAPELLDLLRRLQLPFSVSSIAQAAAIAALHDTDFVARSAADNERERERLSNRLARDGFEPVPSHGNFLLFRVGDGPATFQSLLRQGIIVRPVANYGLKEWLRVTVGLPAENDLFADALGRLLPKGSL